MGSLAGTRAIPGDSADPFGGGDAKSQKVLRKRRKKPHQRKNQILRLKQGFPLLAGPLFCESKGSCRGLLGDRPELAEGVVGDRRLLVRGGDEGGWGGLILWGELKSLL